MNDEHLVNALKAAGVIHPLVFKINDDGETELLDESGYALIWGVEPAEFTFPETIALGTISLPSIVLKFRDDKGNITGFRIPMSWALIILRDLQKRLWIEYEHIYTEISDDFKNANTISNAKSTLIKHAIAEQKSESPDDLNLFI